MSGAVGSSPSFTRSGSFRSRDRASFARSSSRGSIRSHPRVNTSTCSSTLAKPIALPLPHLLALRPSHLLTFPLCHFPYCVALYSPLPKRLQGKPPHAERGLPHKVEIERPTPLTVRPRFYPALFIASPRRHGEHGEYQSCVEMECDRLCR